MNGPTSYRGWPEVGPRLAIKWPRLSQVGRLNQKNRRINGQPGQPLGQPHTEVGQKKGGILGVKMTYLDNLDNLDNLYQRNTPPRLKQGKGTERRRRGGGGLFVGERLSRLSRLSR